MTTASLTSSPVRGSVVDDAGSAARLDGDTLEVLEVLDDVVLLELTGAVEPVVEGVEAGGVDGPDEVVLGAAG